MPGTDYASNAYFLSDAFYHLAQEGCDRRTDKNCQIIAVIKPLHLRFAARVNNNNIDNLKIVLDVETWKSQHGHGVNSCMHACHCKKKRVNFGYLSYNAYAVIHVCMIWNINIISTVHSS